MKRGQASTEYLFLLGLLLVILIPSVYYAFHHTRQEISQLQMEELSITLQQSINSVYRLGTDSQEVVQVHIPAGVSAIQASSTQEVVIKLDAPLESSTVTADVVVPVLPQVVGTFDVRPGLHRLVVRALNDSLINVTDVIFIP